MDRPVEVEVLRLIAGGEIPPPLLRVPGDRRLEEEAVALDQVGEASPPGAEHELDLGLVPGDDSARGIRRVS